MSTLRAIVDHARVYEDIARRASFNTDRDQVDIARQMFSDIQAMRLLEPPRLATIDRALDVHRTLQTAGALDRAAVTRLAEAVVLYKEVFAAGTRAPMADVLRDAVAAYTDLIEAVAGEAILLESLDEVLEAYRHLDRPLLHLGEMARARAAENDRRSSDTEERDADEDATPEEAGAGALDTARAVVLRADVSPRLVAIVEAAQQFGHVLDLACVEGASDSEIQLALVATGDAFRETVIETVEWMRSFPVMPE